MILITYSGLSFELQPSEVMIDGRPTTEEDKFIPIQDTWNGEQFTVQSIFYRQYSITAYMRETEFQNFQNIRYATDIIINNLSNTYKTNANLIELDYDKPIREFRKITLTFANLLEKNTENTILNGEVKDLLIYNSATNYNLYLYAIHDNDLFVNEVNNFKNLINDYKKQTSSILFRYYTTSSSLKAFYDDLKNVKIGGANLHLSSSSGYYSQFKIINKQLIGNNLYKIDIQLLGVPSISPEY